MLEFINPILHGRILHKTAPRLKLGALVNIER